jgi:signal transduction histidine kinase
MRQSLLWKLLGINILVVGIAIGVAAMHVRGLANTIFMDLMKTYQIETEGLHGQFVAALSQTLVQTTLIAGGIGLLLSLILFREVVRPLRSMMTMAGRIASGDYAVRAPVTSGDEIGHLADSLNTMAASLERLERLRKDMVANVAHELRTPLANLRGYLEAVRDEVTAASPETITLLHEEVMRLVRLVQALHELSSFDANLPRMRVDDVDLGALVRRVLELRRPEFAERGIMVHSDVAVSGVIRADSDLLSQALHNLVDNALKYTPHGGSVTVSARPTRGQSTRVAVANTGQGISAADLPNVFERFYRGDKSRSRGSGGAGIGLAIVKEVARVHGGEAGASSEGGETTVWLTVGEPPGSTPAPGNATDLAPGSHRNVTVGR